MSTFTRLPKNVVPSHYVLSIEVDLENFTFTGSELVTVEVKESTDTVVLNSLNLEIPDAAFESSSGSKIASKDIKIDSENETLTITFTEELKPGKGVLHASFKGILNDKMKGFYRAKYPASDGSSSDRYIAATQFEATYARRSFPCWDEPAIKATFQVTLVASKGLQAISNMPITSQSTRDDGKDVFVFDVTPIMSTYLLAFIIGEFDLVETTSQNGVLVRVFTPPGKKEEGRFALDVGVRSLDFFTGYFQIPYPLPKLDFVPISDFASGAMENWGLITGRDTAFLYDPENTSPATKQYMATVNAHEVAHQWFGNLVTMEWWTDLWLNEGFATFMQYFCIEKLMPELEVWNQFVTDRLFLALSLDSLRSSHPVEVPINNPSEIDEIFDHISYSKGASIIAMLHSYIGDDDFKKGMSLYLNRFQYRNTMTADLWASLEEASSKPIGKVMSTWTKQKGFPLITVTESQDGDKRTLKFSQEKFLAAGDLTAEEKECLWMVPISVTCASSPDQVVAQTLLAQKTGDLVLDVKPGEWVKLNSSFVGMYRVKYSESMLDALLPAVSSKTLPPLDRLNILSDIFALVSSGRVSTVQALKVIDSFKEEDEYIVWSTLASCLGTLSSLIAYTDAEEAYFEWGRKFLSSIKSKVGWEKKANESHTDTLLRSLVLSFLSHFKDESVIEESKRLFEAHSNKSLTIPVDIRSCVFNTVARQADEKTFNTLVRLLKETENAVAKQTLVSALGSVKDAALIQKTLDLCVSDDVRSQDIIYPLSSLARHKEGREAVWQFFQKNLSVFQDRYQKTSLYPILVKNMLSMHASEEIAQEIESFFAKNQIGMDLTVSQITESIRLRATWLARDRDEIRSYLNSQ